MHWFLFRLMHLERCMAHVQSKIGNASVRASDERAIDDYFEGVRVISVRVCMRGESTCAFCLCVSAIMRV